MPYQESFDIIAFRSRQHAFQFSQMLKKEGYQVQVMSTPKEVAIGCGLSVRFSPYMTYNVTRIYKRYSKPILGFFHMERMGANTTITRIPIISG